MLESVVIHPDLRKLWKAMDEAKEIPPCTNDPDLFFPEKNGELQAGWNQMKWACSHCPIQRQCLEYAVKHEPEHGFWGGTTPRQRQKIRVSIGLQPFKATYLVRDIDSEPVTSESVDQAD